MGHTMHPNRMRGVNVMIYFVTPFFVLLKTLTPSTPKQMSFWAM
jgi:hypothetical protein